MALSWVRSLIVQCLCRRPASFLKDKSGSGYYGESQDGLYDSDGTWDFNEKGIVNEMGPEIASSFENIPQIVLVECNPVFDEERDLHVNKLTKKFLKVPENR